MTIKRVHHIVLAGIKVLIFAMVVKLFPIVIIPATVQVKDKLDWSEQISRKNESKNYLYFLNESKIFVPLPSLLE